ncbi:hypothetical protein EVAR_8055_1 [Eumeta japonica]|uniref:Uncharacterized protein n=1 Tax=Eumeta variegata TaxID=151549 RepID=A0A4C1TIA1_EUMVA|nr:hypothetical protein EVAR_8055_1 [Eumeta japonica]
MTKLKDSNVKLHVKCQCISSLQKRSLNPLIVGKLTFEQCYVCRGPLVYNNCTVLLVSRDCLQGECYSERPNAVCFHDGFTRVLRGQEGDIFTWLSTVASPA